MKGLATQMRIIFIIFVMYNPELYIKIEQTSDGNILFFSKWKQFIN